jgi:hypothetical protein
MSESKKIIFDTKRKADPFVEYYEATSYALPDHIITVDARDLPASFTINLGHKDSIGSAGYIKKLFHYAQNATTGDKSTAAMAQLRREAAVLLLEGLSLDMKGNINDTGFTFGAGYFLSQAAKGKMAVLQAKKDSELVKRIEETIKARYTSRLDAQKSFKPQDCFECGREEILTQDENIDALVQKLSPAAARHVLMKSIKTHVDRNCGDSNLNRAVGIIARTADAAGERHVVVDYTARYIDIDMPYMKRFLAEESLRKIGRPAAPAAVAA